MQVADAAGRSDAFPLEEEPRLMLLEGLDGIALTLKHRSDIEAWREADQQARPWVYLA